MSRIKRPQHQDMYRQLIHFLSCYCFTVRAFSVLTVYVVALGNDICVWCYVPSYEPQCRSGQVRQYLAPTVNIT
jgi:hypothetical protein